MSAGSNAADRDFQLRAKPLFEGVPPQGSIPLSVTVSNKGPNAKGEVEIRSGGYRMRYPVDLPQGSSKAFVAYAELGNMGEPVTVRLETDRGGQSEQLRFEGTSYEPDILLISEDSGLLAFIKAGNFEGQNQAASALYAKPSLLPDRSTGYGGLGAVILGEGSERIPDIQVAAIKNYVLTGGTLVFFGGASMPVLQDPRWAELLPVLNAKPKLIDARSTLTNLTDVEYTLGDLSVMAGQLSEGAKAIKTIENVPFIVKKRYGMGSAIFFACNFLEQPLTKWDGRRRLLLANLPLTEAALSRQILMSLAGVQTYDPYGGYPSGYGMPSEPTMADPFSAKLPPTSFVIIILTGYLVLVVPVNLWLLRKLNRGELAWITSPAISLAFAAVFFQFAGNLYAAQLSSATKGVLLYDDSSETGYFMGRTQMFFPKGGRYDLALSNVETIGEANNRMDYGMPSTTNNLMERLNPVDVGEVKVSEMAVPNLSFQEFDFSQRSPLGRWLEAKFTPTSDEKAPKLSGYIVNKSKFDLTDCKLLRGTVTYWIGEVKAGERRELKLDKPTPIGAYYGEQYGGYVDPSNSLAALAPRLGPGRVALTAEIKGFRPGPQVGKEVEQHKSIRLAAFLHAGKTL